MSTPGPEDRRLLQLSSADNVCAATRRIPSGECLSFDGRRFEARSEIPVGHKIAIQDIPRGNKVLKYGAIIGTASQDILAGDHVHLHNLRSDYLPTFSRGEMESSEERS